MNYNIGNYHGERMRLIAKKALIILGIFITWVIMILFFVGVGIQALKLITNR
jgi:hypothetical protein